MRRPFLTAMPSLILTNARIFYGDRPALSSATALRIEDGVIAEISARIAAKTDRTIDLGGQVLMPGLIDAHFHAYAAEADIAHVETLPLSYLAHHGAALLKGALMRGFTTVRDAAGADWGLWKAIQDGLIQAPRLFYSGRALSQTGGHGDSRAQHLEPCNCRFIANLSEVADGVDQVRASAREALRRGAHQLKIFVSGGVVSPTDPIWMTQYSDAEITAAVEEAASRRTYVMAHAYTNESIIRAVRCGVRSIEHGNLLEAGGAAVMAEHGAFLVPTLITYEALSQTNAGLPPASQAKLREVAQAGGEAVKLARAAGVQIGLGTDLLGAMHPRQLHEFRLRGEVDTPFEVLRSATSVNARLLNQEGRLGVVRVGAAADLIVVEGEPLSDLRPMWDGGIGMVIRAGEIVRGDA
jgi:imidazolonepropionase-like amidohydrolase